MKNIGMENLKNDGCFKQKIEQYIMENKENMQKDIRELVRFESINGEIEETYACLVFFLDKAKKMGFSVKTTKTSDSGIVEMGSGSETIGILVHLDVVKTGDSEKWSNSPFSGAIHDGFIWGRGTVDDKGPAVMSLYAMKAVAESGIKLGKKIQLIVGTSEEAAWTDIENFEKEFPIPNYGFSPDGEFPIFNAENGYADIELVFSGDAGKDIQSISGGESSNTIPSKAVLTFENGKSIILQGISAHSSTPEFGENAIIKLCKELNKDKSKTFEFARFVEDYYDKTEDGRTFGIDSESEFTTDKHVGVTTVVPTILCHEAKKADSSEYVSLNLNVRHKFGVTKKDLDRMFKMISTKYGFHFEIKEYLDPMYVAENLPFIQIMQEVSREYGVSDALMTAAGTTYAKAMKNFVSWGPVFPEDPACAHVEDERLSINTMLLGTKMYARFLLLCSADNDSTSEEIANIKKGKRGIK